MKFSNYVNPELLAEHIANGVVLANKHPTLPLTLYCYSRKAVYDNIWDEVTCKTRGLIVDDNTDLVIARPYEKFFNYNDPGHPETLPENLPTDEPIITEKLDGSLGIFWRYGMHWGVASKGSFTSDHAQWATKWLENHIEEHGKLVFPNGYTTVFEMICQTVQAHVVHYGDCWTGLHLLSLINTETGEEFSPGETAVYAAAKNALSPVYTFWPGNPTLTDAVAEDREGHEGYVATWPRPGQPPLKVKIKHPTFLKYQKIHHQASPKSVLELLKNNDLETLSTWVNTVDKYLANDIMAWQESYMFEYSRIRINASRLVKQALERFTTRKEIAEFFNNEDNKSYAAVCFVLLDTDGRNRHRLVIWKIVEKNLGYLSNLTQHKEMEME